MKPEYKIISDLIEKNAKSLDMKSLINFVKKRVKDQTGVKLELEIVVVE